MQPHLAAAAPRLPFKERGWVTHQQPRRSALHAHANIFTHRALPPTCTVPQKECERTKDGAVFEACLCDLKGPNVIKSSGQPSEAKQCLCSSVLISAQQMLRLTCASLWCPAGAVAAPRAGEALPRWRALACESFRGREVNRPERH